MAADTSRAPRVFAKHTSMSAAALRHTAPNYNFFDAWKSVWAACGGKVYENNGSIHVAHPVADELSATSLPTIGFHLDSVDEQRGALKALASVAFAASPTARPADAPDAAIETQWQSFTLAAVSLFMPDLPEGTEDVLDQRQIAAENAILNAEPATVRGAMIQLYVGLYHDVGFLPPADFRFPGSPDQAAVERAILSENVAALSEWERSGMFDWNVRFLIRSLVSLSQMGA